MKSGRIDVADAVGLWPTERPQASVPTPNGSRSLEHTGVLEVGRTERPVREASISFLSGDRLITQQELAAHCGVSVKTVQLWRRLHGLKHYKLGHRSIRFRPSEVNQFLAQHALRRLTLVEAAQ